MGAETQKVVDNSYDLQDENIKIQQYVEMDEEATQCFNVKNNPADECDDISDILNSTQKLIQGLNDAEIVNDEEPRAAEEEIVSEEKRMALFEEPTQCLEVEEHPFKESEEINDRMKSISSILSAETQCIDIEERPGSDIEEEKVAEPKQSEIRA